jgi:hypothetical protein
MRSRAILFGLDRESFQVAKILGFKPHAGPAGRAGKRLMILEEMFEFQRIAFFIAGREKPSHAGIGRVRAGRHHHAIPEKPDLRVERIAHLTDRGLIPD